MPDIFNILDYYIKHKEHLLESQNKEWWESFFESNEKSLNETLLSPDELIDMFHDARGDYKQEQIILEKLKYYFFSIEIKLNNEKEKILEQIEKKEKELEEIKKDINEKIKKSFVNEFDKLFTEKEERACRNFGKNYKPFELTSLYGKKIAKKTQKFLEVLLEKDKKKPKNISLEQEQENEFKTNLQKSIEDELNSEKLEKEIKNLIEKTLLTKLKNLWNTSLEEKLFNNTDISSEFNGKGKNLNLEKHLSINELTTSELILSSGTTIGLTATLSLAAGWHTLTYSLMNIFPPAILTTIILSYIYEKTQKEKTIKQKQENIKKYFKIAKTIVLNNYFNFLDDYYTINEQIKHNILKEYMSKHKKLQQEIEDFKKFIDNTIINPINKYIKIIIENKKKGDKFEQFIAELFSSEKELEFLDWRGDKIINKIYPKSNTYPDLEWKHKKKNKTFAIECKYRSNYEEEIKISYPEQLKRYLTFSKEKKLPVFIMLGIGGEPNNPEQLYFIPLEEIKNKSKNGKINLNYFKKHLWDDKKKDLYTFLHEL